MKCSHDWNKIVEVTLPSGYEQMDQGEITFESMRGRRIKLFQKKLVVVLICHKCGKVKKIVESNPSA